MTDDRHLLAALADLSDHLDWPANPANPDGPADLTTRALDEIRAVHVSGLSPPALPKETTRSLAPAPAGDGNLARPGQRRRSRVLTAIRRRIPSWPPAITTRPRTRPGSSQVLVGSRRFGGRWMVVVAATVAVVVSAVVPAAREAVADLLGVGGIRITADGGGGSRGIGGRLDLGRSVGLEEAARLSPGPLPRPEGLHAPTAAFVGRPPGGVTLVWAPDDRLPEVLDHDVGLIVTAFPGRLGSSEVAIEKRGRDGGTTESLTVDGAPAFWLAGTPHEIAYVDAEGRPQEDTVRLSGNALVWERDGVTYRLESALRRSEAVQLAESLPQRG